MKTASCLMIMSLLAAALMTASSRTVHEYASSIPSKLGKEFNGLLERGNGIGALLGRNVVDVGVTERELPVSGGGATELCMTQEQCNKKKVFCAKKCNGSLPESNEADHVRCHVHCKKKCVPNC